MVYDPKFSLAYPAGRTAGFDPNHIAAKSVTRFSGVTVGNGFVNLLSGKAGTAGGTPSFIMDGSIGPAQKFSGASDDFTFANQPTANDQTVTLAVIMRFNAVSTNQGILATSSTDAGVCLACATGPLVVRTQTVNNTIPWQDFAFTNTAGFPFFCAISLSGTTCNSVIRRLDTGRMNFATQTLANAPNASNGTYVVGNLLAFTLPALGNISAAMFSTGFLSVAQLIQWAGDPWSFWYPDREDQFVGVVASGGTPFRQQDWPLAALHALPRNEQSWGWRQTDKFGLDRLPNRQQGWPLPTLAPDVQRTWIFRQTGMIGQDRLPNRQQDWPLSSLHGLPRNDQTWSWRQTDKFGKDTLPFRQQDWQLPAQPPLFDRTWANGFNPLLVTVVVTFPFRNDTTALPILPPRLDQSWLWSQTRMFGQDRLPNRQQDWPNPTPPPPAAFTWAWSQTGMFGQDRLPFRQQDWPLPGPTPFFDRFSWFGQGIMSLPPVMPFVQTDWPLPGQLPAFDQAWLWNLTLRLPPSITVMPFRQQDWSLPALHSLPRLDQSWTWRQTDKFGKDVLPFRQQDWPLPPLHLLPRLDPTFISGFTVVLEGSVINFVPRNQSDWPIPLGHQLLIQPNRAFASPPGINLLPSPPPPLVTAVYANQFFSTMGSMMGIPGNPPS